MISKLINLSLITILIVVLFLACTEESPVESGAQNSSDIKSYIQSMSYSPESLLNTQQTGSQNTMKTPLDTTIQNTNVSNGIKTCVKTKFNMQQNFDDVAILRPMNDVVWPGALVKGNQSLLDGLPEPVTLPRTPVTLRVNLPGMGANGTKVIESPSFINIQAAIDESLDWWNNNAYQDGYVNAASSSFRLTTSYSSEQMAMDVGLNTAWADNNVNVQFSYTSSENKSVILAVYKQAFYDVVFQTPQSPELVFDPSVSIGDVESQVNSSSPAGYVSSVTYGKILMFRMETSYESSAYNLESAFRYAAGVEVDGSLSAEYENILNESSIELITIGGNAQVASQGVSARNFGDILPLIQGESAVYNKTNPGLPIAYTVKYLKDNSLAKMGYTTEYTASECIYNKTHNDIQIKLTKFKAIKDCDGLGGKGDFKFQVRILNQNNSELAKYTSSRFDAGSGDEINIDKTYQIKRLRASGQKYKVEFKCWEYDKNIIGQTVNDSRMNGKKSTKTYSYLSATGTWEGVGGTKYITLNEGTNCSARLAFKISIID